MAAKKSPSPLLIFLGILVAIILIGAAYFMGTQKTTTEAPVLASTTTNGPASQVASAAYSKCVDNGGFVTTAIRGTYGYYQVCNFEDDMTCDLYALYDGQCPMGGVSTIGYSTTAQVFCAQRGGHPQGSENGQCKLPNGVVCSTASVYAGTCAAN